MPAYLYSHSVPDMSTGYYNQFSKQFKGKNQIPRISTYRTDGLTRIFYSALETNKPR